MNLIELKGKTKYAYYIPTELFLSMLPNEEVSLNTQANIPEEIKREIEGLGKRVNDPEKINNIILKLCSWKPLKKEEVATILNRDETHIYRKHIKPLFERELLLFTVPDMPNHPEQSYKTNEKINPS